MRALELKLNTTIKESAGKTDLLQEMERDLKAEQTNIREVEEERTKDIAELT